MSAEDTLIWFVAEVKAQGFRLSIGGLSAIVRMFEGSEPYKSNATALQHGLEALEARFGGEGAWLQPYLCLDDGTYPEDAHLKWEIAGVEVPEDLASRKVIPSHRALDAFAAFMKRQGDDA